LGGGCGILILLIKSQLRDGPSTICRKKKDNLLTNFYFVIRRGTMYFYNTILAENQRVYLYFFQRKSFFLSPGLGKKAGNSNKSVLYCNL